MGFDAKIYFRSKTAELHLEDTLIPEFTISPIDDKTLYKATYNGESLAEATHKVCCGCLRYYGKGYERGPWPSLAAVLMELLASEDVEKVWYGIDDDPPEIDAAEVAAISVHYMTHGLWKGN